MHHWDYAPARPDRRYHCAACKRVFARGHIPLSEHTGPYAGKKICRDCRETLARAPARGLDLEL